jgi:hypothetical protein
MARTFIVRVDAEVLTVVHHGADFAATALRRIDKAVSVLAGPTITRTVVVRAALAFLRREAKADLFAWAADASLVLADIKEGTGSGREIAPAAHAVREVDDIVTVLIIATLAAYVARRAAPQFFSATDVVTALAAALLFRTHRVGLAAEVAADALQAEGRIRERGALRRATALRGGQTDRGSIRIGAAVGGFSRAAERHRGKRAGAGTHDCPTWATGTRESRRGGAERGEASPVTATVITRLSLGAAGFFLNERSLMEDLGQADRAVGAALPIAALQLVVTAVKPAAEVGAGIGGDSRGRGCGGRGRWRWRWWDRGTDADGAGIDSCSLGYRNRCAAQPKQSFEDRSARGSFAEEPHEVIELLVVHNIPLYTPCPAEPSSRQYVAGDRNRPA